MSTEMVGGLVEIFQYILRISLRASLLVLLAYGVRRGARGLPGRYLCVIWSSVFLAFLCPISLGIPVTIPQRAAERAEQAIETVLNLFWDIDAEADQDNSVFDSVRPVLGDAIEAEHVWPASVGTIDADDMQHGSGAEYDADDEMLSEMSWPDTDFSPDKVRWGRALALMAVVWLCGAGGLGLWQLFRYLRTKRRLRMAVKFTEGVYITDQLDSPVLFGYIHPQVYLPPGLEREMMEYAVLHERMHLRRRDYLCKLAAFLICAVHWWNPLVWLMYRSFEDDMERACDEAVLESFGVSKWAYARALLTLECRRSRISCTVGFGGSSTPKRIRNILNFQRADTAKRRISALTAAAFVAVTLLQVQADAYGGSGSLTLAVCASQESWLLPTVEKYRQMYPEVSLEVEVYDDLIPVTYQLQTRSESGKEPDLLLETNRGLEAVNELIREGLYAPLDEFMAGDKSWEESRYVMSVIDSGKYAGSQYVIPLSYNMFFAVTSEEMMEEKHITEENCRNILAFVETLAGLYDMEYSERILADAGSLHYFSQLLGSGYGDEEAQRLMEQICMEYRKLYEEDMTCSHYSEGGAYYSVGRAITQGRAYFYFPDSLRAGLQAAIGIAASDRPQILPVRNLQGQTVAMTASYAGIRRDSENKQNAWNFLRLLMEKDSQCAQLQAEGCCVISREAMEECVEKIIDSEIDGKGSEETLAPDGEWLRSCQEYVSCPQTCIFRDNAAAMEFQSSMEPFYEGERSFEECLLLFRQYLST